MKATLVSRAIEMRGAAVYFLARVAFARCEISHIEAVARTGRDGVRFQESFCRACSMLARTSLTDTVEKVENRTTSKISPNLILGQLHDCNPSQRRYEAPWSFF
jgi:hypothetical protein